VRAQPVHHVDIADRRPRDPADLVDLVVIVLLSDEGDVVGEHGRDHVHRSERRQRLRLGRRPRVHRRLWRRPARVRGKQRPRLFRGFVSPRIRRREDGIGDDSAREGPFRSVRLQPAAASDLGLLLSVALPLLCLQAGELQVVLRNGDAEMLTLHVLVEPLELALERAPEAPPDLERAQPGEQRHDGYFEADSEAPTAAWPAARRAVSTRKGEQLT
jgi:hypothetical protein